VSERFIVAYSRPRVAMSISLSLTPSALADGSHQSRYGYKE